MLNLQARLIEALVDYQGAMESLGEESAHIQNWIYEARHGRATSPRFRAWLQTQIDYYGPKDRSYAKCLQGLLD